MQNNAQTVQFSSVPQYNDFIDFDSERCFYPYGKIWSHTPGEDFTFLHRHNFIEAGVLLSGAGVFNIDGNVFPVKAPAVSIIYPGQMHSAQSSPFSPSVWNFLYFDPILAMPDISAAKIKNLRFNNLRKYDVDNVLSFRDAPAVFYAIKSAIDCIGEKTPNREYAEGCLFAALSAHNALMRKKKSGTVADDDVFGSIAPAINYINAHFRENLTVPQLAEMCFLSHSSLLRSFKRFSGLTPQQYLSKVRINNAAARLSNGGAACAEVAFDCGFGSLCTFNRQFLKAFGMTPSQWIKQHDG